MKECFRFISTGQGPTELEVLKHTSDKKTAQVKGDTINRIIQIQNSDPYAEQIQFEANVFSTYSLYYAYHPSSGFKTTFDQEGVPHIERPRGGVLCAFTSEVVVLEKQNK